MESTSLRIVKRVAAAREMELREVAALLPRRTNDHLDLYPLAILVSGGYIDMGLIADRDGDYFRDKLVMEIAIQLYMWIEGKGSDFEYHGMRGSGSDFSVEKMFATAKAYFYLDERRSKRTDRAWALAAGILIAIVATTLSQYIRDRSTARATAQEFFPMALIVRRNSVV